MATISEEEFNEFYNEETEHQDAQAAFEEAYVEAVIEGNANDDDDDSNDDDEIEENNDYKDDEDTSEKTEDDN